MLMFLSLFVILINSNVNCIKLNNVTVLEASPCPRLFTYEGMIDEPDRWYGILTLLSESDLTGVWIRIVFDKPIIQLGNWFGEVVKRDQTDYLIKNPQFNLKAHTTQVVRIFVKYDVSDTPPQLLQFRINGKTVCPENLVTTTPSTTTLKLFTSEEENPLYTATHSTGVALNNGFSNSEYEQNEKPILSHPNQQPAQIVEQNLTLNEICGTIVEHDRQGRYNTNNPQVANKGQFPWHAVVYYTKGITIGYLCGAILISKYHLITVAHCVITKHKPQLPLDPEVIIVYLGKNYVKHWAHEPTQTVYVSDIKIHPGFNPETYTHDIALLKLLFPAEFTDVVRPVCLWQEPADFSYIAGKPGTVVGWGFDETGKIEDALMHVKMIIREQEVCSSAFSNYTTRFASSNAYCANFLDDKMECVGDSGGGMIFPTNINNSKWQLRGLVVYSAYLQRIFKCTPNNYVVFTDVAKYLDWIKENMV